MRGIPVSRYVIHERYDRRWVENDIALLRLRYRIELGSGTAVTAACLPAPAPSNGNGGSGDRDSLTGRHAVVTGWGTTSFSKNSWAGRGTADRSLPLSLSLSLSPPEMISHPIYLFPEGDTSPILQEASLRILSLSDSVCQTGIATGNAVESKLCAYSESGDACQVGKKVLGGVQVQRQRRRAILWPRPASIRACVAAEFTQPGDHGFARNLNFDKSRVTAAGPSSLRTATLALSWASYPTE